MSSNLCFVLPRNGVERSFMLTTNSPSTSTSMYVRIGFIVSSFRMSSNRKPLHIQMSFYGNFYFTSRHNSIIVSLLLMYRGSPPSRDKPEQCSSASSLNTLCRASSSNAFPKFGSWASLLKHPSQCLEQPQHQRLNLNPRPFAMSAFLNAQ